MSDVQIIPYKRSRFSTRLPVDRLYTPSHFWLVEAEKGIWRVGFTKFATRMLGDMVEFGFEAKPGDLIAVGQAIGWVEGFKALTDLYCVVNGKFLGVNPDLNGDITLTDADPYGAGWLYSAKGEPEPNSVDVRGYMEILDLTVDRMQGKDQAADDKADDAGDERCPT
jgi:glycine cleavage system H protein